MYKIEAMTLKNAEQISMWKYPCEYSIYSFENSRETILELMNGEYFSCINAQNDLTGYFCFGESAQIPTETKDIFDDSAKDIGLGLSPELCGHGYGKAFLESGMMYAKRHLNADKLRLVVAEFNKRAMNLYQNCGFSTVDYIEHQKSKTKFIVMQCIL